MDFSRRWFLKSAVMAAVATQLPFSLPEGQKVLFLDGGALVVSNYTMVDGVIRAKVVNGAWDLVVNTRTKRQECWCNPSYGYDNHEAVAGLVSSQSYKTLLEIEVPHSVGEVSEEMKPRTVLVQKFVDKGQPGSEWVQGLPMYDDEGNPIWHTNRVPAMREVTRTYKGNAIYDEQEQEWFGGGELTFTSWEKEYEETTVDPLNGAGMDYNALVEAAEKKAGIVRPVYYSTPEVEEVKPEVVAEVRRPRKSTMTFDQMFDRLFTGVKEFAEEITC